MRSLVCSESRFPKGVSLFACGLLLLAFQLVDGLGVPDLRAQETGTVQGQVVDENGTALPSLNVIVRADGAEYGATTDRSGNYRIPEVPAGEVTVSAAIIGYEPQERTVTVRPDATTVASFQLVVQPLEVAGITVVQRDVLRTLERKRQASEIVDVLDVETLQQLPIQDLSEGLDQLPAVHIQSISPGRGFQNTFIVVRGIQPNLNSVTVMGMPIVSTTGDRAVALDVLPGNLGSQLEVVKAVTPDMDPNAIGGTVNIAPMSAFDRQGPYFFASVQGGAREEVGFIEGDDIPLDISLAGSTRLGETFGIAATANFNREDFSRVLAQPDGWEPIPQEGFPADLFVPEGTRLEQTLNGFERRSGTLTLDWRPQPEHSVRLLGSYTTTEDDQFSTQTEWNYADGKDDITFELQSPTRIFTPQGENEKEMDIDHQKEKFYFVIGDGEFRFDSALWNVNAGYVKGELDTDVNEWSFDSPNFPAVIDLAGEFPWALAEDEALFFDPGSFTFAEIDVEPRTIGSEAFNLKSDLRLDLDALGEGGFIKFGGVFRPSETFSDADELQFEFNEASGFTDISLEGLGIEFPMDPVRGFPLSPGIDPFDGPAFIENNPDFLFLNPDAAVGSEIESDYRVEEDVLGEYAMATFGLGRLELTGGLRVEHTNTKSVVSVFIEEDESFGEDITENDYTNVLPSVLARYQFDDRLQFRAAWTNTIARPRLTDLAGSRNIDFDNSDIVEPGVISDADIEQGNPLLDPFESMNFDATLEFYRRPGSLYMAGLFYKNIDNPIFIQSIEQQDVMVDDLFFREVDFEQPLNAGSGDILGLEAQVQETFTFLPSPLSGFGISANVAILDSEFEVPGREDEDLPFFQQPDLIASIAPFFNWGAFSTRMSYQFTDSYVVGFGSDPTEDEFFDDRDEIDLQFSYDLLDRYTVSLGFENLTNEPLREYQGIESRTSNYEELGSTVWFGIRGSI